MTAPARAHGDVRTVLALRALGLGDALTGVPALRGLRRLWPDARLVLAAPEDVGSWLAGLGVVDAVLPAHGLAPLAPDALVASAAEHPEVMGGQAVDVAVNLHGNGTASAVALAALEPARVLAFASAVHPDGPAWRDDEHEVLRWCRLVQEAGGTCGPDDLVLREDDDRTGVVVVHPGAASGSRRWPAERWARVVAALRAQGRDVVVTGSPDERGLCSAVARDGARDLAGALDLPELTDLVAGAALLLCGDTGVAHLATATRTPSVLLFGPTPPQGWGPAVDADRHAVLWRAPDGSYRGDPHGAQVDPVLAATGVDDVLAAAGRVLGAA